jgi:S1-C subfamily serine protease
MTPSVCRTLPVVFLLALAAGVAEADQPAPGLEALRWEDRVFLVVADGGPVRVPFKQLVENPDGFFWKRRVGCAVYLGESRFLLSTLSIVGNNSIVEVFRDDGQHVVARVLGTDPHLDLALLEAVEDLPGVEGLATLTAEVSPRPGAPCLIVGSAYGRSLSACRGVVGNRTLIMPTGVPVEVLRIDVPIFLGDSGGPVLDPEGRFLGLVTAVTPRESVAQSEAAVLEQSQEIRVPEFPTHPIARSGFAVPAETCLEAWHELRVHGRIRRGFLGVQMPLTPTVDGGARILRVLPGSPAEMFGILPGDRIIEFGPQPVTDGRQFSALVASYRPNAELDVRLLRDNEEYILRIRLGEAPRLPTAVQSMPSPVSRNEIADPELTDRTPDARAN